MTTNRDKKLPMMLVLKRKSIRLYPKNISVGLYYSDDLDQHFVISTQDQSINMSEESLEEAKKKDYEIYHSSYTSAVLEALRMANEKGYDVDDDEWFRKVSTGPKKPGVGKTNSIILELIDADTRKPVKKTLHIQVYGMEKVYELTTYVS